MKQCCILVSRKAIEKLLIGIPTIFNFLQESSPEEVYDDTSNNNIGQNTLNETKI